MADNSAGKINQSMESDSEESTEETKIEIHSDENENNKNTELNQNNRNAAENSVNRKHSGLSNRCQDNGNHSDNNKQEDHEKSRVLIKVSVGKPVIDKSSIDQDVTKEINTNVNNDNAIVVDKNSDSINDENIEENSINIAIIHSINSNNENNETFESSSVSSYSSSISVADVDLNPLADPEDLEEELALKKIVVINEGFQLAAGEPPFMFEGESYEVDTVTCLICFSTYSGYDIIFCADCDLRVCFECMENHISAKIREGIIQITCPGDSCSRTLSNQLIAAFSPKLIAVYKKNQIELENNPNRKTCPNCHKIETHNDYKNEEKRKIQCSQCKLLWCFHCHAPWHTGIKCENFVNGGKEFDKKALKYWAKNKGTKNRNATKCPSCNFYIERISGCDHMTCLRCKTSFCYRCGNKYRSLGWLGDHYSTYSFLGCKYNLSPNKPVTRVAIRSCVAAASVVGVTVIAALAVPVCASALAISPIILGCYVVNKKC